MEDFVFLTDAILFNPPLHVQYHEMSTEAHHLPEECRERKNNPNLTMSRKIKESYSLATLRLQECRNLIPEDFQFALEVVAFANILTTEFYGYNLRTNFKFFDDNMEGRQVKLLLPRTKFMKLLTQIVSHLSDDVKEKMLFKGFLYGSIRPLTDWEREDDVFQWLIKLMQQEVLSIHNLSVLELFFESRSNDIILSEIKEFQQWIETIRYLVDPVHCNRLGRF